MKNKKTIFILIVLLVIGFAGISATLLISGKTFIGENVSDYKIYFSEAILDDKDKSNSIISENKQVINFETKELIEIGDESVLNFEVTNNSKQYDANVKFTCKANDAKIYDYVDLHFSIDDEIVVAKSKTKGSVKTKLKSLYTGDEFDTSFTCSIETNALEKETVNDTVLNENEYYTYGYLINDDKPVSNAVVVIYSSEPKYAVTDVRGMYIVSGLEGGDHEMYVLVDYTLDEVKNLTKEEIRLNSIDSAEFNTRDNALKLARYESRYFKVKGGNPETRNVLLDANGGLGGNLNITLINGEPIGYLPEIEHDLLLFKDYEVNGEKVDETDVVDDVTTITAKYKTGVAAIGEKNFKTLEDAYQYASVVDENIIDLLETTTLTDNLDNRKNIIINLNGNTINLDKYKIINGESLTIKNGFLKSNDEYVIENAGTLNLIDNLNVEHINTTNETEAIKTITNNENAVLNIRDSVMRTEFSSYVPYQSMISNYGEVNTYDSTFNAKDSVIFVYENSVFNTNDSNYVITGSVESGRLFQVYGTLNYDNSTFRVSSDNEVRTGAVITFAGGLANLNSGVFDNTYGKGNLIYAYANSRLNLGKSGQDINIIGNGSNNYSLVNYGELSILNGTVNASNGPFIGDFGQLTIGSSETIPIINGGVGTKIFDIRTTGDNQENRIINANINVFNGVGLGVSSGADLIIDNATITQENETITSRLFSVTGHLIINGGTFKTGENNLKSAGLILANKDATIDLNSGVFDNTYGKGAAIYTNAGSTLNIGSEKGDFNIMAATGYYAMSSAGDTNIVRGTINVSNNAFLTSSGLLTIGTDTTVPTLNGAKSSNFITIKSNKDNKIVNANINGYNGIVINVAEGAKLTVENATITQENETSTNRMFDVTGHLIINNGLFKTGSNNVKSTGILTLRSLGTLDLNSGVFDNTYGKGNGFYSYDNSTINIGESNEKINFIGNNTSSYTFTTHGDLNIIDGTIDMSKTSYFVGSYGKLTVGTSSTAPTINGAVGTSLFDIRTSGDNQDNQIISANINVKNNRAISVYSGAKLIINNVNVTQANTSSQNRMINVSGELTVNNGTFNSSGENNASYGIFNVNSNGLLNIDGGSYTYLNASSNLIYTEDNSTVNIGQYLKFPINISSDSVNPLIANHGNLNIYAGNLTSNSTNAIVQRKGADGDTFTEEENLAYEATIKIYGGKIVSTNDTATISVSAGRLELIDGEVINNGTGKTIYNKGGTAIQRGGTSKNNFGVTVE